MIARAWAWIITQFVAGILAVRYGLFDYVLDNDQTYIGFSIMGLYAISWMASIFMSIEAGRKYVRWLYYSTTLMVILGLMGTVVGFQFALENLDSGRTEGISTALSTTALGLGFGTITWFSFLLLGGKEKDA